MRYRHPIKTLMALAAAVGLVLPLSTATVRAATRTTTTAATTTTATTTATTTTTTTTVKIDRSTCADLMAMVDAVYRDPVYGPQLRAVIPSSERAKLTVDDCTLRTTTVSPRTSKTASTNILRPNSYGSGDIGKLREYWQNIGLYQGPWNYAQFHVNVGIIWHAARSYSVDWGPDCYLTSIPGFMGGYDSGGWCGVYNPRLDWIAQPGSNFWFGPVPGAYKRWAWMRYYAYSNGSTPGVYGGFS